MIPGGNNFGCRNRRILCLMPIRHGSWSTTPAGPASVPILQAFHYWLGKSASAPNVAAAGSTNAAGTFGRSILSRIFRLFWLDVSCGLFRPMQRPRGNHKDFGPATNEGERTHIFAERWLLRIYRLGG